MVENFPCGRQEPVLPTQYCCCWWPGTMESQGISSHGIHPVILKYSGLSNRLTDYLWFCKHFEFVWGNKNVFSIISQHWDATVGKRKRTIYPICPGDTRSHAFDPALWGYSGISLISLKWNLWHEILIYSWKCCLSYQYLWKLVLFSAMFIYSTSQELSSHLIVVRYQSILSIFFRVTVLAQGQLLLQC